jgi:hypothetical protein
MVNRLLTTECRLSLLSSDLGVEQSVNKGASEQGHVVSLNNTLQHYECIIKAVIPTWQWSECSVSRVVGAIDEVLHLIVAVSQSSNG